MKTTPNKHLTPCPDVKAIWLWINNTICDETRINTHKILTHRQVRNSKEDKEIQAKINKIWIYILKHEEIFTELLKKHPELWEKKYIKNKMNIYFRDFFECIENSVSLGINYEQVVTDTWKIVFNEALLRVKNKENNFNHLDYLDIYNDFWLSFSVFFNVLYNVFEDIKSWKAKKPISINVEISDINHPDFIDTIKKLEKHFNIKIWKWDLLLEILENQKIPRNSEYFIQKIEELQKLWIPIALDDTISKEIPHNSVINNIKTLSPKNIKVVKIDWKTIHSLYNIYQAMWTLISSSFNNLKNEIIKLKNKWIFIVAEWIEDINMLTFVKSFLWVTAYQWYYFKDENAVNNLKQTYETQN